MSKCLLQCWFYIFHVMDLPLLLTAPHLTLLILQHLPLRLLCRWSLGWLVASHWFSSSRCSCCFGTGTQRVRAALVHFISIKLIPNYCHDIHGGWKIKSCNVTIIVFFIDLCCDRLVQLSLVSSSTKQQYFTFSFSFTSDCLTVSGSASLWEPIRAQTQLSTMMKTNCKCTRLFSTVSLPSHTECLHSYF